MGKCLSGLFLTFFLQFLAMGQEIPGYNHNFNNLYLINPAAAGGEGYGVGFLTYHKYWTGIEGAPETASLSFNTPTKRNNVSLGFNIFNDRRSILSSSGALFTVGYSINFSEVSSLRFGLSGGASFNSFDMDKVVAEHMDDEAIFSKLNNSFSPDGNFGIQLNLNGFHAGFAMPKLFAAPIITGDNVAKVELQQFNNLLFNIGWKFNVIPKAVTFHPMAVYRMYDGNDGQFEASGIINFHESFWIGGNYRQEYGYAVLAGIKIKKVSIGYAYEMPSSDLYRYSGASHEVQLGIHFGKKKVVKKKTQPTPVAKKPVQPPVQKVTTPTTPPAKPPVEKKPEPVVVKPAPAPVQPPVEKKPEPVVKPAPEPVVTKPAPAPVIPAPVVEKPKPEEKKEPAPVVKVEEKKDEVVYLPAAPKKTIVTKDTVKQTIKYETATKTYEVPMSEKVVIASRGKHRLELPVGNYVIVGAFSVFDNATRFKNKVTDSGFPAQLGFNTEKNLYYVYIYSHDDMNTAIERKNEMRKIDDFKNAWLFIVE